MATDPSQGRSPNTMNCYVEFDCRQPRVLGFFLSRANGVDLAGQPILQAQLTVQAVVARPKAPFPIRDHAGEVSARRVEVALERARVLLAPADNRLCFDGQAVAAGTALQGD